MSTHNRSLARRNRDAYKKVARAFTFRRRLDGVLLLGFFVAILTLCGGCWAVVQLGQRYGCFDPPAVQPLADERILENVRDNLETDPLLDAVFHPADDHLYVSQKGGTFHRYDPVTHLWDTERPFSAQDPIASEFILLRSGCGDGLNSPGLDRCPDKRALWAVGADGSLARRDPEGWHVIVGNSRFVGNDGLGVRDDDLVAAAVSDDKRWLLLGTRDNGIGLYHTIRHRWLFQSALAAQHLTGEITHIVWWRDYFWVGTSDGLFRLKVAPPQIQAVEQTSGRVVDLDADPDGDLWVLENRACRETSEENDCVWLGKFTDTDRPPETLVDEQNHYTDLNLGDLIFAQQTGHLLTLAGSTGVYTYDTRLHTWNRLVESSVVTVLPLENGDGFYYAQARPSGVGVVRQGSLVASWPFPVPSAVIAKLLYGQENEVLALTQWGDLYSTSTQSEAFSLVYERGTTALDPGHFASAVTVSDTVLFASPDGLLLHDTRRRLYHDVASDQVPHWLLDPDVHLVASGDDVYAIVLEAERIADIYALPGSQVVTPDYYLGGRIRETLPYTVPGPIQSAWAWGDKGLGVLAADDSVYRFTVQADQRVTGKALSLRAPLSDVAQIDDSFAALVGGDLKLYDLEGRSWSSPQVRLVSGEILEELLAADGRLLLRTSQGRLVDDRGDVLIGGEQALGIADADLSDVTDRDQHLYLAGDGRVEQYDMDGRHVTQVWDVDGGGDVDLCGLIDAEPLTLVNGQAALGETILSPGSTPVTNLSYDPDFIWTVRQDDGHAYLMGHDRGNLDSTQCYFRNPTAGSDVARVYDARALAGDLVAVSTNAGLKFYDMRGRTWHDAPPHIPQADRIYYLDSPRAQDYLLLVTGPITGSASLTFIEAGDVEPPHSCSTASVDVHVSLQIEAVRAVTVDESKARVAWIASDGRVVEWEAGRYGPVVGPETPPPAPTSLRRAFDCQTDGYLLFTTDGGVWRYDLGRRTWTEIELQFPVSRPSIANATIETQRPESVVTVQAAYDRFYYGILSPTLQSVSLQPIIDAGDIERSGVTAEALLDVQTRVEDAATWTVVLHDRVLYFDPETRTWEQSDPFSADDSLSFQRALNRGILLSDDQASWQVGLDPGPHPRQFVPYHLNGSDQQVALDSDGNVWRLSEGGELLQCEVAVVQGQEGYRCDPLFVPFTLDPTDVVHAFDWQQQVLFETETGLRAFDRSTGQERDLPLGISQFNLVTAVYALGKDQLWLYSDRDNRLLLFDGAEPTLFEGIFDLRLDENEHLWARFVGGWRHYDAQVFKDPKTDTGLGASGANIRLFVAWDSRVTGIAPDGRPYYWNGSVLVPAERPFPQEISPDRIDWLVRGLQDDWWLLSGSVLTHVIPERCVGSDESQSAATVTPEITPTLPPPTSTPSLTPTLPPLPCYYTVGQIPIQAEGIVAVGILENGLEFVDRNGQAVRVTYVELGHYAISTASGATVPAFSLDDQWERLQGDLHTLPNGWVAYDPITQLVVTGDGQLEARRLSGVQYELADEGAFPKDFELPPPLDVGWLRWNRDDRSFTVKTGSGNRDYTRQAFIDEGQFLFESVDSVLAKGEHEFHVSNRYGLWVYTQPNLSLNDPNVIFYPISLSLPTVAAHGHFLTGGDMVRVDQGGVVRVPIRDVTFDVGAIQVTERIRLPIVTATVDVSGEDMPALTPQGFIWDTDRRALAYSGPDLLLQSDAGIHPVTDPYLQFDAGPQRLALSTGLLQADSNGNAYLLDTARNAWYQYDGALWRPYAQNPHANRTLLQDNVWRWALQRGRLDVELLGAAHDFALAFQGGFGFNADRLLAATSFQDALYVVTDAFLEIARPASQLSHFQAPRSPPIPVERLETFRFADGSTDLYSFYRGAVSRWDGQAAQFVPNAPNPDPEQWRSLVATDRLRFTWDAGSVIKQIRVDDLSGNSTWVTFDFINQRFPFDYVTAVAYFDQQLHVGTAVGLQIYTDALSIPLTGLVSLYDMRQPPTGTLASVVDVGVPASDPDRLIAYATNKCIERRSGQPFRPCTSPPKLYPKLRFSNPFWQWMVTDQGEAVGRYYRADGQLDAEPIDIDGGRLPHDRIHGLAICQDRAFTLWDQRWVMVHPDDSLALQPPPSNYLLNDPRPLGLICVENETQIDGITVPSGAYLETTDHQLWTYDANGWQPVLDLQRTDEVYDYAANPPLFERARLRLRRSAAGDVPFEFEHFGQDQRWQVIPWQPDHVQGAWSVGVDDWQEIVLVDDQIWVATPPGIVAIERSATGEAYVDTNRFALVREPKIDQAVCPITDLDQREGTTFVRCSDDSLQVYRGHLTSLRATGVLTLFDGVDPFAEQVLIDLKDTDFWEWRLTGRRGGYPGDVTVELQAEPMQLAYGRFSFDTFNSMALFWDDRLELVTDDAGWFWTPRQTVAVADLARPAELENAAGFEHVGVTHDGDERFLCLASGKNDYVRLDTDVESNRTVGCPEYVGLDDLWLYLQDDDGLSIAAPASVGRRAERHLFEGRFTDDIVVGLPMTTLEDDGLAYWLPTRAGVVVLDADWRRNTLHASPFNGLDKDEVPFALYAFDGRTPAYLGYIDGARLYQLDQTRNPLTDSFWHHPSPTTIRAIENGPDGLLRVRWADESGCGWSYVSPGRAEQTDDSFRLYVGAWDKYHHNERALQGTSPEMISQFGPDSITFRLGRLQSFRADLPDGFELIEAIVYNNQILVIGQQELLEVNLETILGEIVKLNELGR